MMQLKLIQWMTLLLIGLMGLTSWPAVAATCHSTAAHQICIQSVQRSAKNYWEYRVKVTVDGVAYPIEVYNCRDRTRITADGTIAPFELNGAGVLICRLLNR